MYFDRQALIVLISRGDDNDDYCLLEHDAVLSARCLPLFPVIQAESNSHHYL
jgi:hypothetical protein